MTKIKKINLAFFLSIFAIFFLRGKTILPQNMPAAKPFEILPDETWTNTKPQEENFTKELRSKEKEQDEEESILRIEPLSGRINTAENQFGLSVARNGNVLYYYSRKSRGVYNSIYRSQKIDGKWSMGIEVTELNSKFDDQSPFVTANEEMIFFSSNRDGSVEFRLNDGRIGVSRDIYVSVNNNGRWATPVPISPNINTYLIEENPFLSGSQLFFVRYPFGQPMQANIYVSHYDGNIWQTPQKLPAPINSEYSDIAPVISADGKIIYFASNRPGGFGGYDIYASEINKDGSFSEPVNMGGEINTAGDEAFLVGAAEGKQFFFARRKTSQNYDIYSLTKSKDVIARLQTEKKISLNSIHFESGKYIIKEEAFPVLDKIAAFLLKQKKIRIKITGHTDVHGDAQLNLQLSKERAEQVKKYLVKKGVAGKRIETDGKGSQEPIYPTASSDTDWYNRRTEFEILE